MEKWFERRAQSERPLEMAELGPELVGRLDDAGRMRWLRLVINLNMRIDI